MELLVLGLQNRTLLLRLLEGQLLLERLLVPLPDLLLDLCQFLQVYLVLAQLRDLHLLLLYQFLQLQVLLVARLQLLDPLAGLGQLVRQPRRLLLRLRDLALLNVNHCLIVNLPLNF